MDNNYCFEEDELNYIKEEEKWFEEHYNKYKDKYEKLNHAITVLGLKFESLRSEYCGEYDNEFVVPKGFRLKLEHKGENLYCHNIYLYSDVGYGIQYKFYDYRIDEYYGLYIKDIINIKINEKSIILKLKNDKIKLSLIKDK